jgi:SOS-response transcriptional repressor LexA
MTTPDGSLSIREWAVLDACVIYYKNYGFSPSIRDLMYITEINSTSLVRHYLNGLEKKGMIKKHKGLSRSIVVIER